MAVRYLDDARRRRSGAVSLREGLKAVLGAIDPVASPLTQTTRQQTISGSVVEAVAVHVEDGIQVPLLVLKPANSSGRLPLVVAVAQGGKRGFLFYRSAEIAHLLASRTVVCLPDLRGIGETSPDQDATGRAAQLEMALGGSLVGARLKDLRTVLAYLRARRILILAGSRSGAIRSHQRTHRNW